MDFEYVTYEDEASAAHACEMLLKSGFPARQIHALVWRDGVLRRAPIGRTWRLGYAALAGAAFVAAIGGMLTTLAILQGIVPPHVPGVRPPVGAILALTPFAAIGAVLGAALSALRWKRKQLGFPAANGRSALVAVEVSPGNAPDAESILRTGGHEPHVTVTDNSARAAARALEETFVAAANTR